MRVSRPNSIIEAFDAMGKAPGTFRLAAGVTALQLDWARGVAKPDLLIDLAGLKEMRGLSASTGSVRIGASVTLNAVIESDVVQSLLPMLNEAAKGVAGPAVRNLATIGGNIAGRTGCLLPALLALDAELEVAGTDDRRFVALADWLARPADPAEILLALHVDAQKPGSVWTQRKLGLRRAFSPSVVGVAALLDIENGTVVKARVAVGGGPVPAQLVAAAKSALLGMPFSKIDWQQLRTELVREISAPDDNFRTGRYRRRVAANAIVHGLSMPVAGRGFTAAEPTEVAPPLPDEIVVSHDAQPARWFVRPDVEDKIAGRFPYLTDRREPGMLVGRILRAGVPHAKIVSIDTRAAEALPGVAAVVTHRDIRGDNAFGIVIQDQPALCFDKVRHKGDPVAAVAAVDARTAEKALGLIRVEYEALPTVSDPVEALAPDAPAVHATGNLQTHITFARGDIEKGFAAAAHVVENTYITPRQMHGFMETEGGYALLEADGTLSVRAGGQHGARDRMQLSRILGMPEEKIHVVTSPTGGGFGGKDELSVQPALALLALKTGRSVRLQLSRAESVLAGQKRNPMTIRMKTACDADGRLLAQQVDVIADAGAYISLGSGVLETALEHASGPYIVPNVATEGRLAYTNNGICGAFRGFGANQMTYAMECQMDQLAARVGLTPLEIRARNLRKPGDPGYLGQEVAKTERSAEMLAAARGSVLWKAEQGESADDEWIVGTGMALNYQGNGLGSVVPDPSGGCLALSQDGFIVGGFGMDEMGQGLLPLIQATYAAELGCAREDVLPVTGDTRTAPDSGSTSASRGTYVVWATARKGGAEFTAKMLVLAGARLGRAPDSLVMAPGGFAERGSNSGEILLTYKSLAEGLSPDDLPRVDVAFEFPKNDYKASNARYVFCFGAALTRVAISRVTGEVRVLDLHQHTAAGPVMDMAAYLGQMEGGTVQGLGFTLSEDALMRDGSYLTGNLDTYVMPSIADAPERMRTFALESVDDDLGPRGAGELGIGAVTPAIANAVYAAVGYLPTVTPISFEAILDALEKRP